MSECKHEWSSCNQPVELTTCLDCGELEITHELLKEVAELQAVVAEALSNMEYYPASLGEMWLVQDSDITAMQDAINEVE